MLDAQTRTKTYHRSSPSSPRPTIATDTGTGDSQNDKQALPTQCELPKDDWNCATHTLGVLLDILLTEVPVPMHEFIVVSWFLDFV